MIASLAQSIVQRHHRRHMYRFGIDLRAFVSDGKVSAPARVEDLSSIGAGWISSLAIERGAIVTMRFETNSAAPVETRVRVASVRPEGQGFRYGGEFVDLSEDARRRLVLFLYQQHAPTLFAPVSDRPQSGRASDARAA
jgi:hypothetical protein